MYFVYIYIYVLQQLGDRGGVLVAIESAIVVMSNITSIMLAVVVVVVVVVVVYT